MGFHPHPAMRSQLNRPRHSQGARAPQPRQYHLQKLQSYELLHWILELLQASPDDPMFAAL